MFVKFLWYKKGEYFLIMSWCGSDQIQFKYVSKYYKFVFG